MTKLLQIAAGVLIAALGVFIFTRQVEMSAVLEIIGGTPAWKIAAVVLLNGATLYLRSLRWGYILPDKSAGVKKDLFAIVSIGFMVNNLLPMRVGEAVRALLTWKRNGFTLAESIGTIVIERLFDSMVYGTFLCAPILLMPGLSQFRHLAALMLAGIAVVNLILMVYAFNPGGAAALGRMVRDLLPAALRDRATAFAQDLMSNLDWLFSAKKVLAVAVLSFATIFCQVAMLSILGMGIENFNVLTSMFGTAFAAIGAAIPLAPGYVGTLHAMVLNGLGMAGIGADAAGALAVMYHAIGYVSITALGLFFFFRLKVTLADIRSAGKIKSKG